MTDLLTLVASHKVLIHNAFIRGFNDKLSASPVGVLRQGRVIVQIWCSRTYHRNPNYWLTNRISRVNKFAAADSELVADS
jgi:hypothetical protein